MSGLGIPRGKPRGGASTAAVLGAAAAKVNQASESQYYGSKQDDERLPPTQFKGKGKTAGANSSNFINNNPANKNVSVNALFNA